MRQSDYILGITVFLFLFLGGIIDYWQSARHHHKPLPASLEKYFGLFWLILYSGLLPFILVFSASGFNLHTARVFIGTFFIGIVVWDMVYSLLDKKTLISGQKDYWFWGGKDYSLSKNQIVVWHIIRLLAGSLILLYR